MPSPSPSLAREPLPAKIYNLSVPVYGVPPYPVDVPVSISANNTNPHKSEAPGTFQAFFIELDLELLITVPIVFKSESLLTKGESTKGYR